MDSKICRVCLNKNATISVFADEDDIKYSTRIMRCVNVVIEEGDGLPDLICSVCVSELTISYDFVQKCEAADDALRRLNVTTNVQSNTDVKTELDVKEEDDIRDHENYDNDYILEPFSVEMKHTFPEQESIDDFLLKNCTKEIVKSKYKKHKAARKKLRREKTGPIQCVICGLMANSQSAMEIHMRKHTGERPFSCPTCCSQFPSKGALKRHIETHHSKREKKFICETCGRSFYRKNDIITHMRIHTDERPYSCPYCSSKFRQIASLIRHKRVHTGDKPYPCPLCCKKFGDKGLVKKHLLVHSDEKKFSCHLCDKTVKSKTALNAHITLHSNKKHYVCSYCGMAFAMKGNLMTHMKRVHSEKSGQCTVCLKTFSDLEMHMRKHTGEKPFICGVCRVSFGTKRSLAHHMVFKHENATKYKCSIGECTKTFPTAMMLEFHLLKQHTNHTPYICQHCSRGFFRTSDLSRHLRVNHNMDSVQIKMQLVEIKPIL